MFHPKMSSIDNDAKYKLNRNLEIETNRVVKPLTSSLSMMFSNKLS